MIAKEQINKSEYERNKQVIYEREKKNGKEKFKQKRRRKHEIGITNRKYNFNKEQMRNNNP